MGIIACEKCGCANVSDSRFCRMCGFELSASVAHEPSAADLRMIEDAQRLFAAGRYDQAALVATAVLDDNPYCAPALAVMGDCHERLGYYSLALKCYNDVLKLDPESKLDHMRVERLEKLVESGEIVVPRAPQKRNSLIGAFIAATLLFVSSGSALIVASDLGSGTGDPQSDVSAQPFMPMPPTSTSRTDFTPTKQTAPIESDLQGLPVAEKKQVVAPLIARNDQRPMYTGNGALPGITGEISEEVAPVKIDPKKVPAANSEQKPLGNSDPDPAVVQPPQENKRPARDAIVDVRPSRTTDPTSGTAPVEDDPAASETLVRVARDQFIIGNYSKAADAYEKALRSGAPPATSYQRLAQCYEKLGRYNDAVLTYTKAISAFEKLDQTSTSVQTQLDACRQALKVLRGQ